MKMNQVSFPLFLTYFNNEPLALSDLYILEYIDTQVSNVFRLFINFWHVLSIPLLKNENTFVLFTLLSRAEARLVKFNSKMGSKYYYMYLISKIYFIFSGANRSDEKGSEK